MRARERKRERGKGRGGGGGCTALNALKMPKPQTQKPLEKVLIEEGELVTQELGALGAARRGLGVARHEGCTAADPAEATLLSS